MEWLLKLFKNNEFWANALDFSGFPKTRRIKWVALLNLICLACEIGYLAYVDASPFSLTKFIQLVVITELLILLTAVTLGNTSPSVGMHILQLKEEFSKSGTLHSLFQVDKQELNRYAKRVFAIQKRFYDYWRLLLFMWIAYFFFKFLRLYTPGILDEAWANAIFSFANVLTTVAVFMLYSLVAGPYRKVNFLPRGATLILTLAVLLIISDLLVSFGSFRLSGDRKLCYMSMNILEAALAGVVMALFAGRMDSRFMRLPVLLICALYLFAVSQIIVPFSETTLLADSSYSSFSLWVTAIVVVVGLVGKLAMFGIIQYCNYSGRLFVYLFRIQQSENPDFMNHRSVLSMMSYPKGDELRRINREIRSLEKSEGRGTPEEQASVYFDLGDLHERKFYLSMAKHYYDKAANVQGRQSAAFKRAKRIGNISDQFD